jgi:hypothetical protein
VAMRSLTEGNDKVVLGYTMKAQGVMDLKLHLFLIVALGGGYWSDLPPPPRYPRAGLGALGKMKVCIFCREWNLASFACRLDSTPTGLSPLTP